MTKPKKKAGKLRRKLLNKYRLVVLNEETYEEQLYFRLTRLNVMIISILLITATFPRLVPWSVNLPQEQ